MKRLIMAAAVIGIAASARAELTNAALADLGATATGSGAPFNRQWPASGAIQDDGGKRPRGGTIFGVPMPGGTVDIELITPCDIERIDLMQLDYHETMNVKKVELAVDGRVVKTVELAEKPVEFQEIPLKARGQRVSVKCLETFPPRVGKNGKTGPSYGGWARIRVMTTTDVKSLVGVPETYAVKANANALMPTGTAANGAVKAYGEVRVAKGHPCTTWDAADVKRFRAMMAASPELKAQALALRRAMDKRLTQPLGIPQPEKGSNGEWLHISDTKVGKIHNSLSLDIANLGTCYQLFGDDRYAEFAKRLLLAYADAWPNYGVGARPTFHHDPSKVFDQRLGDATWLIQIAVGYDFIHDYKGITAAEREHIEKDLVAGDAYFIRQNSAHLRGACNWSAIGTAAILAAGYACDDMELVNTALFGMNWLNRKDRKGKVIEPKRWWEGTPNAKPSGVELHFSEQCIDVDGMWCEGAMGYHFMALQALVVDAEILRHHGIDLYRYRNGALKCIFDSPLLFAYPNLISPAIHDSGNANIVGREAYLYEYGYLNYRDPKYLEILRRTGRRLGASFQQFTVSTLYDVDVGKAGEVVAPESSNLNGVGYGILRLTDAKGTRSTLLDYGPNRSHGHPDKLNLDIWGFGELLVPDPGSTWYEKPIYRNWFRTTFAHNTLNVDMQEQKPCGAELLVYAPGESVGLMRGRTDGAYAGVMMDRAVFQTAGYVADLFGAFGKMSRTYDLAWHPVGDATEVKCAGEPVDFKLAEPRSPGYSELTALKAWKSSRAEDGFSIGFTTHDVKTALVMPADGEETLFVTAKAQIDKDLRTPVFARRKASSTVFGSVYTYDGSVPKVKQLSDRDHTFAALAIRGDDGDAVCYASFRDGVRKCAGIETDAQQAFVAFKRGSREAKAMILGGGTLLKAGGCELRRSTSGSALVEITETGSYFVRNCGADAATISGVMVKPFSFKLAPGETKEIFPNGGKPVAEYRHEIVRKLAALQAAKERAEREAKESKTAARRTDAAKYKVPADFKTFVQAEDFASEDGGEVRIITTKTAVIGTCFSHWDADGQSLQWKVNVPATGYYKLALCYCSDSPRHREVAVNGSVVTELGAFELEATGGFANGSDDWKLVEIPDPIDPAKPMTFRFEAGENTLRLTNVNGGGVNLDYLVVAAPSVSLERLK